LFIIKIIIKLKLFKNVLEFSCQTFVFFPERWGRVEQHVANSGLDLCIATEKFDLCVSSSRRTAILKLSTSILSGPVALYSLCNR
jgi:hypothetical protein